MFLDSNLNLSRAKYRSDPGKLFVPPTLVADPPDGTDWEHEIKYDGYRRLIVLDHGKAWAFTRNGHLWTDRYAPVVAAALTLQLP